MFAVGSPNIKSKKLIEVTYEAMWKGIKQVKPGNTTEILVLNSKVFRKLWLLSSERFLWTRNR